MVPLRAWPTALSILVVLATGCNTPQIPLPPPDIEAIDLDLVGDPADETIVLSNEGDALPGAVAGGKVYISLDDGHGVIAPIEADLGFTTQPFVAADGSRIEISYTDGVEESQSSCAVIRYQSGGLGRCPN